ncbi:MAG: FIST C-terminal domain-containing protein [Pirellulaceae bacterium]|nr:FIST C-terminal domain-containing protein [Pirellulaceae bacterium]
MFAASAVRQSESILTAVVQAFDAAAAGLRQPISLIAVFFSCPQASQMAADISSKLAEYAPDAVIVGCSAESVLGMRTEVEGETAASVFIIAGLDQPPRSFHVEYQPTADGPSIFGLPDELLDGSAVGSGLILFADPFTFPMDLLMQRVAEEAPGLPILGGYASGATGPGDCGLVINGRSSCRGAVGILLPPEIHLEPAVSQGCRPVGEPMVVTKIEGDVLLSLSGQPALQQLRRLYEQLPTRDQELMLRSLLIGRAIHEYHDRLDHGDFLVRQCMGVDDERDGVVLTDRVRAGQTVQFHVRDSETADADLQAAFKRISVKRGSPFGALMFTCNGRGSHMFRAPHHDALIFDRYFPQIPLAGFFAAGEFGPIGVKSFMHGFTATAALLYFVEKR